MATHPLDLFLPPVRQWFAETLGEPTPAQRLGWPVIASGQNVLILAPTGSGKTLAAFLACLDQLWREPKLQRGVHLLYVSPLKALNNDIHRNLQEPLEGVTETARRLDHPLPILETAIRTGDTPTNERQKQIRRPPHVLITTPESLHLLLTSRGRETLRNVRWVIVDEIHAVCSNKRGVFLSLLLERLEALQDCPPHPRPLSPRGRGVGGEGAFVRIGLSATQRPLDEVARFLGGCDNNEDGTLQPRAVTVIDAGLRKDLDLQVVHPVQRFGPLAERSVWPYVYDFLRDQIGQHRSTLIFANNRRSVERITSSLNVDDEIARAHHGSVSLEVRQQTEQALKDGRLAAVVATASLELGIDMGAVDLVCQVESTGNVAQALQRVGRAGHLVGQKSKGRLIPKTPSDLLEQAVLAREMAHGRVEAIRVPTNCLDVLAQQIIAMVAMQPWHVHELLDVVRRAYPYRDLSAESFQSVLEMVAGRYRFGDNRMSSLQPRVSWDRVHQQLHALPGSQHLALVNGGTIPDTGQYAAVTSNGARIGELDEEFIYERRIGDSFMLGTNAWRIDDIGDDRVTVIPAEGAPAMIPFWRGESVGRSADLGIALGKFLRELTERLEQPDCSAWLSENYFLDANAARDLVRHVKRQFEVTGHLPTDRKMIVEASRDQLGDWQVIVLSAFGRRLHYALRLAIEHQLERRLGYRPQCIHHDDGLLIRLTDSEEPVLDVLDGMTEDNVEEMILTELTDSALFGLRFRQNAARALLMPRGSPGKRAPLWLQRLRGRDLLQVARKHRDFPVVIETYRECLQDHLDVPRLRETLESIRAGEIEIVRQRRELPSPFAANLLFSFTAEQMYHYDGVESDASDLHLDQDALRRLIEPKTFIDPRAVQQVQSRLRGVGQPPRSVAEMAEWLRRLGDLTPTELEGPMESFAAELLADGRAQRIELPECREPLRWILTEEAETYEQAFVGQVSQPAMETERQVAAQTILWRFLESHALVGLTDVLERYPFDRDWVVRQLQQWSETGRVAQVPTAPERQEPVQYSMPENLERVQRTSLGLLRREIISLTPAQWVDFVLRWQCVHPQARRGGDDALAQVLSMLQGVTLPLDLWERTVLPARLRDFDPQRLEEWIRGGLGAWIAVGESAQEATFFEREHLMESPCPIEQPVSPDAATDQVLAYLQQRGACFAADVAHGTELSPSVTRSALWNLASQSLVTNDSLDVLRCGRESLIDEPAPIPVTRRRPVLSRRPRHARIPTSEGRWSLVPWRGEPHLEAKAIALTWRLLRRYGIVTRELALLDQWMLPWRVHYEVLSRLELAGDVRRGYFVEGLSGAQFGLPEAVDMSQDVLVPSHANAPAILLHSQDPANLYGAGAPLDVPLLEGATRSFSRRDGNWLVIRAGRPILLIEQQGKRITSLPTAGAAEIEQAVRLLPTLCDGRSNLRTKLIVEEWNGQPVTRSEGRQLLESVGFVRDYQAMALYVAWRSAVR